MQKFIRPSAAALLIGGLVTLSAAAPALGANTVNQSIQPGTRSVTISGASLSAVTSSGDEQVSTGTLVITADDSTGSAAGWGLSIRASAFVSSASAAAPTIPASSFALATPAAPVVVVGQPIDPVNGPLAGSGGSLDVPRTVMAADAGHGLGTYTQNVAITLRVPAGTPAGTYVGSLMVSFDAGSQDAWPIEVVVAPAADASSEAGADSDDIWHRTVDAFASVLNALWSWA